MKPDVKKALIEAVRRLGGLAEECAAALEEISVQSEIFCEECEGLVEALDEAVDEVERAILLAEIADDAPSHG